MSVLCRAARFGLVSEISKHSVLIQVRRFGGTHRIKSYCRGGKTLQTTSVSAMLEKTRCLSGSTVDPASRVKRVSIEGNIGNISLYFTE